MTDAPDASFARLNRLLHELVGTRLMSGDADKEFVADVRRIKQEIIALDRKRVKQIAALLQVCADNGLRDRALEAIKALAGKDEKE